MSQKTEPPAPEHVPELSNTYLTSLVVGTAIVLVLVFGGSTVAVNPLAAFHIKGMGVQPFVVLHPWIVAGAQSIANGLSEFSGNQLMPVESPLRLTVLLSVLVLGVITPTLTLMLMGKHAGGAASAVARGIYLVSLMFIATFAVTILPTAYAGHRARLALREAQAVQTNKDNIISDLNVIAWKLREHRIVPKALGGGEGEIEGYTLPAWMAETDEATYVLQSAVPEKATLPVGEIAKVHTASKKYPDSAIDVTIVANGYLRDWTYKGQFQ